jgi:hypothetical protein
MTPVHYTATLTGKIYLLNLEVRKRKALWETIMKKEDNMCLLEV